MNFRISILCYIKNRCNVNKTVILKMETSERDEMEMLIKGKPPDVAADIIIQLMNRQDVKILSLCHENFPDDIVI